jgi:hypothetical protein
LQALLAPLRVCFTAPTFVTFTMLVTGALAQTAQVSVCGMLVGAGVAGVWHHSRGHRFFAAARWCPDALGVLLADMIVARLVPAGAPITVIVDDTLFRRGGPKVHAAAWLYDGAAGNRRAGKAADAATVAWGNNWVVAGLMVTLPFTTTPICLPVLSRLWQPGDNGRRNGTRTRAASQGDSRQHLARDMIEILGWRYPDRAVHVVLDAAYGARQLRDLPPTVTLTTRLRADAALWNPPPPRNPGTRGRPRTKGDRVPRLATIARTATDWATATVTRYRTRTQIQVRQQPCLWYDVWLTQPTRLILLRETTSTRAYDIALITTDLHTPLTEIIERYAARWAIEVCFHEAKQTYRVGQARNRTHQAVHRTVAFALLTITITTIWYTTAGHDPTDITDRRARQPWYRTKTQPSASDMLAKLRRVIIAEQFRPEPLRAPTPAEITAVHQAWTHAGT